MMVPHNGRQAVLAGELVCAVRNAPRRFRDDRDLSARFAEPLLQKVKRRPTTVQINLNDPHNASDTPSHSESPPPRYDDGAGSLLITPDLNPWFSKQRGEPSRWACSLPDSAQTAHLGISTQLRTVCPPPLHRKHRPDLSTADLQLVLTCPNRQHRKHCTGFFLRSSTLTVVRD